MAVDRDVAGLWMNQILQLTLGKHLLPACLHCSFLLWCPPCLSTSSCLFNFSFPFDSASISLVCWSVWLQAGWLRGRAVDVLLLWSILALLSHVVAGLGQIKDLPGLMSCLQQCPRELKPGQCDAHVQ